MSFFSRTSWLMTTSRRGRAASEGAQGAINWPYRPLATTPDGW